MRVFSKVFNHLARNSHKSPDLRGMSRYLIFRHLLDPHLVLEQLRTKPSLFGIRGYKGSLGLTWLDNIQSSVAIQASGMLVLCSRRGAELKLYCDKGGWDQ